MASNIAEASLPNPAVSEKTENTAPSTAGMTTKVVKGSLWTLAGQVAPLGVSLFATPFVIRLLGAESYGVLILVVLIPTYLGFADFGMGIASTKFASEAYAEGDPEKEARIVRTAALIALCSSLPFAIALFALSGWLVMLFNVPAQLLGEAALALRIASVTFVVNFLNGIFNTPQLTRLRMDLNTFITSGFRILGLLATPFVLYLGFGIVGAVTVLLLASTLTLAGHVVTSWRLDKYLLGASLDREATRSIFKFGGAMVAASIAAVLLVNIEKGILSATVSATALAYYSIAFTLASMMTMFSSSMVQSLMPAFSQLQSPERNAQLNALYSRGVRLSVIWIIPALAFLAVVAKPFFSLWAGEEFARESSSPFYVLLFGVAFNILAFLPNAAIMASGRSDVLAKLYWIELIIYTGLAWFLASRFGALGAAVAWSIRVSTDAMFQFAMAKKLAGANHSGRRYRTFIPAAVIMILPFAASLYYGSLNAGIIIGFIVCLIAYSFLICTTILEKEEISWMTQRLHSRFSSLHFNG